MCIAIPARVVAVDGLTAEVERFGERSSVSLFLLAEPVAAGDYLILQAQRFAVEKIGPAEAEAAWRLFAEVLGVPTDLADRSDRVPG